MRQYFVYMITNRSNATLYTGVTSDLIKRIFQHKNKVVEGFSNKYNLDKLVYYEIFETMAAAIEREKQIKRWRRDKKDHLIELINPQWKDMYNSII